MKKPKLVFPCFLYFVVFCAIVTMPLTAQTKNDRKGQGLGAPNAATGKTKANNAKPLPPLPSRDGTNNVAGAKANARADVETKTGESTQKSVPSDGSEFIIPKDASPKELLEFADKLLNTERDFNTEEEYKAWIAKMIQTAYNVASLVLKMEVDDEIYMKAAALKGEMIYYHVWNKPDSFSDYEKYVRALQKDKRLLTIEGGQNVADGQLASYLHEGCVRTVQSNGSMEDLKKFVDEFQELVMRNPDYVSMIPDIVYPVSELAVSKKDPKLMKDLLFQFSVDMKKSDNQTLKDAAAGLEGILRFAELDGKPFQIVGTTVAGEKFDSSALKGKVYLVNFWATWVTPCIAQYPELLALYVQYKDKGFEIVGYNMDEELDKFDDYVKAKNVPWLNISEKKSVDNKQPSLSEFYGITTIPTLILVGEDGKVLENDIDLEQLKVKLAELFK